MTNLVKLEFVALDVNEKNYMSWIIDVKMHLESIGILEIINENNNYSSQEKAKANVFLRKHVDDMLKFEYLNTNDPSILWKDLKERLDHQREILLPAARDEWRNLRFQDFKKVNEYNSALFRICSQLKFYGQHVTDADMLDKTYSTFHASNITLQLQYRLQKFIRYSELSSVPLVAEQNNELLMKNHQSRPTGSVAFPEVNATNKFDPKDNRCDKGRGRGFGRGCGRSRIQGYNQNHGYGYNYNYRETHFRGRGRGYNNTPRDGKSQQHEKPKKNETKVNTSKDPQDPCFRCEMIGRWSRTCRTAPHLCKLYQESLNAKEKEVNFNDLPDDSVPKLNALNFFDDLDF